jgi:hypothetical protein
VEPVFAEIFIDYLDIRSYVYSCILVFPHSILVDTPRTNEQLCVRERPLNWTDFHLAGRMTMHF